MTISTRVYYKFLNSWQWCFVGQMSISIMKSDRLIEVSNAIATTKNRFTWNETDDDEIL